MKLNVLVSFAFVICLFASCEDDGNKKCQIEFDLATFEKEKTEWSENGVVKYKYDFVFSKIGEGDEGTVIIDVNSNPDRWYKKSINNIYDYILSGYEERSKAIMEDNSGDYAISKFYIDITYDPVYHYPSEVEYRCKYYNTDIDGATGYTLKISNFEVVND
ncbi:MAG: hypothetical protein LBV74_23130 [Tannerella sp.]|jgi:hypothetical protein|nr:hypothetical protein [Tannerella sp.]